MARSERWLRTGAALASLLGFATCVPLVELDSRPCPCSGEYRCCATTETCLLPGEACPAAISAGGSAGASSNGGASGNDAAGSNAGDSFTSPIEGGAATAGAGMPGGGNQAHEGGSAGEAGCTVERADCGGYSRISNVLLLIYNPMLEAGGDLRAFLAAPDARALSAELAQRLRAASGGVLNYHIAEARELRSWPPQRAGTMPLNEATFMNGVYDQSYVSYAGDNSAEGALNADYAAIFAEEKLCSVVRAKNISEIWLWGAHNNEVNFGFDHFSYRLASNQLPASATEVDAALYARRRRNLPDCGRTLWLLGAQYSEGLEAVGKAHRSYNFRSEELLELALRTRSSDTALGQTTWARFSQHQLGAGDGAHVGTPAYTPNAGVGEGVALPWDYSNLNDVFSSADLWFSYPALSGTARLLDCTDWDCSNEGFQSWYSLHLPRNAGSSPSGSCNNWWQYVADPELTLEPCCGAQCEPRAALGLPCASDSDCASGHCACADAAVCVAGAVEPCGSPNWSLCVADGDCSSEVCGCNGGPLPRQCLPSEAYARDCSD